jgi:hypothetical protein
MWASEVSATLQDAAYPHINCDSYCACQVSMEVALSRKVTWTTEGECGVLMVVFGNVAT